MASVYARNGILWIKFYDPMGKPHSQSLQMEDTKANRAQAKQIKLKVEAELRVNPTEFLGKLTKAPRGIRISEVAEEMLREQLGDRSESTIKLIRLALRHFIEICGDRPIRSISGAVMREFRAASIEKYTEVNTRNFIRSLGPIFTFAASKEKKYIEASPITSDIRINIPERAPLAMLDEELDKVFAYLQRERGQDVVKQLNFLLLTGFRSNESCQFVRRQINFEQDYIERMNLKGNRVEPFPLYGKLKELLMFAKGFEPTEYVFKFRSKHTLAHYFKEAVKECELNPEYHVHTLRKTFLTRLAIMGVPLPLLMKLGGHHQASTTTNHYIWFNMTEARKYLEDVSKN